MRYDNFKTPFVKPRVIPHGRYILPFIFNQWEVLDFCPVLDIESESSQSVHLQELRRESCKELRHRTFDHARSLLVQISYEVTRPHRPCPSSDKPPALSSPLPLSHRNPCSCPDSDLDHTAVLALTAAGTAVVVVTVKLVPVIAMTTSMFGGDVVDEKGNIGMVVWRKVRVKVQMMRRMRQRYSRRPWWSR